MNAHKQNSLKRATEIISELVRTRILHIERLGSSPEYARAWIRAAQFLADIKKADQQSGPGVAGVSPQSPAAPLFPTARSSK